MTGDEVWLSLQEEKPEGLPGRFHSYTSRVRSFAAAREWSTTFGSPELTGIVETALDRNLDIAAAVAPIITLSTTETTLFQNEDILAQVRLAYFQSATSLYQALGGGWTEASRLTEIARENAAYEADKGPWP